MLSRAQVEGIVANLEQEFDHGNIIFGKKKLNNFLFNYPENIRYVVAIGIFDSEQASKDIHEKR